jgi:hypothetical protein
VRAIRPFNTDEEPGFTIWRKWSTGSFCVNLISTHKRASRHRSSAGTKGPLPPAPVKGTTYKLVDPARHKSGH